MGAMGSAVGRAGWFVFLAGGGAWADEVAVTGDAVVQVRSAYAIGPDDSVYAAWLDWADFEDTKVGLTRSVDLGATWSSPVVVFDGAAYDDLAMVADEHGVHVFLVEFQEGEENEFKFLHHATSMDGGETFSDLARIGGRANVEQIKVLAAGGMLYLYAKNYTEEDEHDLLYVSADAGATWAEGEMSLGTSVNHPALAERGGVLHMAFGGFLAQPDIHYASSDDGGATWSAPVPVSNGAGRHSQLPTIAVDGSAIHVAWEDDREGHFNVVYTRSTDGGATWSDDVRLNDTFYGARTKLLADAGGLHIVWCQYHGDDGWPSTWSSADYGIIWYRHSADSGETWTGEFRVSQNEQIPPIDLPDMGANYVRIAPYSSGVAAMWQDKRDGNVDIYLRNRVPAGCVRDPQWVCDGDADGDGQVNPVDSGLVQSAFGSVDSQDLCNYDVDCDGQINPVDSGVVQSLFGTCAAPRDVCP